LRAGLLALIAAVAVPLQSQQHAHPPKPAPSTYVTSTFGLAMRVPKGLHICALPSDWSGTEDGTVLFLKPPSECVVGPERDSSVRLTSEFAPHIMLRYRANLGRNDHFDGKIPPARSSMELAGQLCAKPEISRQFKLLNQPAVTCRSRLPGEKVRVVLFALYDSGRKLFLVSLTTTQAHLAAHERVLAKVASGITACGAVADAKGTSKVRPCPKGKAW
jgi:hypothetical protein